MSIKESLNLIVLLLASLQLEAFNTLSQAQEYARLNPEYPSFKGTNIFQPDYSQFYTEKTPSIFTRFLERVNLKAFLWSPLTFKNILQEVVKAREERGYYGDYIFTYTPQPQTEFILIGPLLGAFHSLVRNLIELHKQGFITPDLHVIKPQCYIIFNGDLFNYTPYGLETFTLVLALMKKNPDHVVYIQGSSEKESTWKNSTLKSQLKIQAQQFSHEKIPFNRLITRFFNTLPLGFYLNGLDSPQDVLRISYFSFETSPFNEIACQNSLTSINITPHVCKLSSNKHERTVPLRAFIKGENRLISYKQNLGLTLLESELGATTWSVFSGPNKVYREYFSFFYDAFSVVKTDRTLSDATITLYHQDVQDLIGFKKAMTYNLVTGQMLLQPVSTESPFASLFTKDAKAVIEKAPRIEHIEGKIELGSTMDLSKGIQTLGKAIQAGISALVNRVNQSGGIDGKLYQVTIVDDQYNPALARSHIERFVKNGINLILCPVGTPTVTASLDLIKNKKVFVLFPNTGTPLLRKPDLTNVVHFRSSYTNEAKALTYHALRRLASKRFALFYQNDSYGRAALEGAVEVLKKEGIKDWIEASYLANTLQVEPAIDAIKTSTPDTIMLFSTTGVTIELIRQLGSELLASKKVLAISPLGGLTFKQFVKSIGLPVTFSQVMPNPATSTLQIVQEYRQEIVKQALAPDTYSLEGYIAASLTANYLRQIQGPITFNALLKLIENTKNHKFKGLTLNFDPQTRELAHFLWIEQPNGEWIEQNLKVLEISNENSIPKK